MRRIQRRTLLQSGLLIGSGLGWRRAQACEFYASTLRVSHPWARATAADAPHALLCLRLDEVTRADRLLHVETPVADAAVLLRDGQPAPWPLDVPVGRDTVLSELGLQLRLQRLNQPLEIGRSYPLRLVFEQGGAVNALLNIDYGRFS
jgi:hypothetical protein